MKLVNKRLFVAAIVFSVIVAAVVWKYLLYVRTLSIFASPPRLASADSRSVPDFATLSGTLIASTSYVSFVSKGSTVSPSPAIKKVFYYDSLFGMQRNKDGKYFSKGRLTCPSGIKCLFTPDKSEYLTSDAAIIHGHTTENKLLPNRPPNQKWVYMNRECPWNTLSWHKVKNVIDLTMTYVSSSDILFYYGRMVKGNFSGGFNMSRNYLENKTKTAVAVISHCVKPRLNYIHALSKFIDIHVYGRCGNMSLCKEPSCWDQLRQYKFYLAFENTVCVDYVTEKLYANALMYELVPVVIGGGNYSDPSVAPPGGCINAREFSTVKQLADLMSKVGSDPQLYNQYFHWHSEYTVTMDVTPAYCQLCSLLYSERDSKRYELVTEWYNRVGHCEAYPPPL